MGFLLRVTAINAKKWRTLEDSNLWPLPSEGSHRVLFHPLFRKFPLFCSRSKRVEKVQTVTRNRYRPGVGRVW